MPPKKKAVKKKKTGSKKDAKSNLNAQEKFLQFQYVCMLRGSDGQNFIPRRCAHSAQA